MLIFALLGLGIPPPPFHSAPTLEATGHGQQLKAPFALSPLSTHQPLGSSLSQL